MRDRPEDDVAARDVADVRGLVDVDAPAEEEVDDALLEDVGRRAAVVVLGLLGGVALGGCRLFAGVCGFFGRFLALLLIFVLRCLLLSAERFRKCLVEKFGGLLQMSPCLPYLFTFSSAGRFSLSSDVFPRLVSEASGVSSLCFDPVAES